MYVTFAPVPRKAGKRLNFQRSQRLSRDSGIADIPNVIEGTGRPSSNDTPLIRPSGTFSPRAGRRGTLNVVAPRPPRAGRRGALDVVAPRPPRAGRRGALDVVAPRPPQAGRRGAH